MDREKILIVDDDRNICELLRLYLEKEGYETLLAHDGETAVSMHDSNDIDLVLLDVMMPRVDGWEACRRMRAKKDTPIIMLTAKGETFDKVLGLELGADDYIVKPFDTKEVVARIKAVLRRTGRTAQSKAESHDGELVFDNLVDEDKLKAYIQAGGGTDYLEKKEDFGTLILTNRDDFSVGDSDIHLVISTGDVNVNCDFEGTIFANGTITVSNSVHSLKTNSDAVSAMLRYYQPMNGQNVMVAQVLRAGEDFVFALEDAESNEDATSSLADLIVYENWKKE